MAGAGCVAIGSDLRFGVQFQTLATDHKKVHRVHDRLYVGLAGLGTDAATLLATLQFKHNLYRLREERDMRPAAFTEALSATLYEKRFGPYFVSPVVAGLGDRDVPYLAGMDSIGAVETATDFMVAGTAPDSLYGMCESMWRPGLDADALFETVAQCLLSGQDRDALAGWGAVVYVVTKDGAVARTLKGRMD
jgi:20S proteasome subunit beta 3